MKDDVLLNRLFRLKDHCTTPAREMLAGFTAFLTLSYIIFVNPNILQAAGMNFEAVFVATCLAGALGSLLMAFLANYPLAVAPGMAVNVYFTYVIVQKAGYSWETALGAVFLTGIIFLIITITPIRQWVIAAIPKNLVYALSAGIGIFIALLALKSAGLIDMEPNAWIHVGHIESLSSALFVVGLLLIVILDYFKILGALLISILVTTVLGFFLGLGHFYGIFSPPPSLKPTLGALQFQGLFHWHSLDVLFTLFLVVFFDGTGTLLGLLHLPEMKAEAANTKRLSRALLADSIVTIIGSWLGTASTSPFTESAAGIRMGGRTGLTALTIAFLFLIALFFAPLAKTIPIYAVTPALLYVGLSMTKNLLRIDWRNFSESLSALVTIIMIPISFSIASGLGLGILIYLLMKLITGKIKELNGILVIIGILFILYFLNPIL